MPKKITKKPKKIKGGNIFTDVINSGQDIIATKDEEYGNREIDWGSIFGGGGYNELQGDGLKEWFLNLKNVILNPRKYVTQRWTSVHCFVRKKSTCYIRNKK